MLKRLAARFGYFHVKELHFARSAAKRLDEHRELVESIEKNTKLFQECPWHIGHMAIQDDHLMRLYCLAYGQWPKDGVEDGRQAQGVYVRTRPAILGVCNHSAFTQ